MRGLLAYYFNIGVAHIPRFKHRLKGMASLMRGELSGTRSEEGFNVHGP